jgi:hypothetical protein
MGGSTKQALVQYMTTLADQEQFRPKVAGGDYHGILGTVARPVEDKKR